MTPRVPIAACLLAAGCGQPAPVPAPKPTESGYIARVAALPAGQRDGVLFRAIQAGGGQSCQNITQVETMPPVRPGQPAWRVTCSDGGQWSVSLADDGTALVTGARR